MSRTDHSKGCPNGRDCGVCSPGKGVEKVLPRDRRKLQDGVDDGTPSNHDPLDDLFEQNESTEDEWANWDEYQHPDDDADMDFGDWTLSDVDLD